MTTRLRPFAAFLIASLLNGLATAGPMTRNVETVLPRIGQCGTTVEVRIQGVSLSDPQQIVFYKPGIRALDVRPAAPPPRRGLMHGAWIGEEVRCRFVIAKDCPPGEHLFRLRTATELTNIGTFHVSPFPVIDEEEAGAYTNDSLETAKPVPLNVTVRGVMDHGAKGDRDYYRVSTKAGQRLSVEVDSARIANKHYGDSEFDLALRLLDADGQVLAANDDNSIHVQDPLASVKLLHDGDVFVEVSRSVFAPRRTNYCVHIGAFRRPATAFPPGGQAGTTQSVRWLGDPSGEFTESITIPSVESDSRTFPVYGGGPSPHRFRSSPFPNVVEDSKAEQTVVDQIPAALNGIIDSAADTDAYQLTVTKGDRLRIRLSAASLGSPIDAAIRIRPINPDGTPGPVELQKDDTPVSAHDILGTGFRGGGGLLEAIDPSVVWTPARDGDYLLEVIDTSGSGGPTAVYRVEIDRPSAAVHTWLRSRTNDWTESMRVSGMVVPRGNRWTLNLSLSSGQATWPAGEFNLIARGLPRGVRLINSRIRPGTALWPIQFEADADAEQTASVITLHAQPVGASDRIPTYSQQCVPFINHSGGDAWRTVRTDRYVAAVTERAPFSIEIDQPGIPLVRGGGLNIPVRVTRQPGFTGAVEFRCGFAHPAIAIPPPTIIPPEDDAGVLQISARSNAPLETSPLVVLGSTVRDDMQDYLGVGHVRVSSKIVQITIAEPYIELAAEPSSIRRGQSTQFRWRVRHHTPFEGTARVKLLGLPKGVATIGPPPEITSDSQEVVFELAASDEALLGQATGLLCEVTVPVGEQMILQRTGSARLRIDPRAATEDAGGQE